MECNFRDMTLADFSNIVASDAPTPGGGTMAAWCGVQSVALVKMVYSLTINKKCFEHVPMEKKEEFIKRNDELNEIEAQFYYFMKEDSSAFTCVMDAFKLPKTCQKEIDERVCAIQDAYSKSAEVPLSVAKLAVTLYPYIRLAAEYGNRNAVSDAGVSALLAHTAAEGAAMNVKINSASIKDQSKTLYFEEEIDRILKSSTSEKEQIIRIVYAKIRK